jgi:hypothetical protein
VLEEDLFEILLFLNCDIQVGTADVSSINIDLFAEEMRENSMVNGEVVSFGVWGNWGPGLGEGARLERPLGRGVQVATVAD